jgi:hypothetical protein
VISKAWRWFLDDAPVWVVLPCIMLATGLSIPWLAKAFKVYFMWVNS